jgi:hydroxyacylglutathione hydrolase
VDRTVSDGDLVPIGEHNAQVIDASGHTLGHTAYHLPDVGIAFVGDSLFALGCGRMFEGTPPQFWDSLKRLRALPADTMLYCAHEYTAANARFALHADPDNAALQAYVEEITARRAKDEPTVPFILAREIATNPFLRADAPEMQAKWGGNAPHETFAALRAAKDSF